MKLIIQIDLDTKESKILSIGSFNTKEIISIICKYFNIEVEDLITPPLQRTASHILCRKIIVYFLLDSGVTELDISRELGYSNNSAVWDIHRKKDKFLKNLQNKVTMFNINKLLRNYEVKY